MWPWYHTHDELFGFPSVFKPQKKSRKFKLSLYIPYDAMQMTFHAHVATECSSDAVLGCGMCTEWTRLIHHISYTTFPCPIRGGGSKKSWGGWGYTQGIFKNKCSEIASESIINSCFC